MTLDTNILIAYLNGEPGVINRLSQWKQEGRAMFVSSISVAEVLALPDLSPSQEEVILQFLRHFFSVPFDDNLAQTAALFSRRYGLKLPDAAIAATAVHRYTPLVSRDRLFRRVKEMTLIEI